MTIENRKSANSLKLVGRVLRREDTKAVIIVKGMYAGGMR